MFPSSVNVVDTFPAGEGWLVRVAWDVGYGSSGTSTLQDFSFERNVLLFLFRPNEITDWEMGMARYLYGRFAVCIRLILVSLRLFLVSLRLISGGFGGDFSGNGRF